MAGPWLPAHWSAAMPPAADGRSRPGTATSPIRCGGGPRTPGMDRLAAWPGQRARRMGATAALGSLPETAPRRPKTLPVAGSDPARIPARRAGPPGRPSHAPQSASAGDPPPNAQDRARRSRHRTGRRQRPPRPAPRRHRRTRDAPPVRPPAEDRHGPGLPARKGGHRGADVSRKPASADGPELTVRRCAGSQTETAWFSERRTRRAGLRRPSGS